MSVGSSALGVVAVGVALLTIEPLFFALGVLAAVLLILTRLGVGRALYRFAVEQTPTDRPRNYIQFLLVDKDPAKEIRAYELGGSFGHASPHSIRGGYRHCGNWSANGASRASPAGR
jgi:hypothetical protein